MIRSKILDKYGIKMCEIKSYGLIERTISSYKDKKKGQKYVREKILQILREADWDYIWIKYHIKQYESFESVAKW